VGRPYITGRFGANILDQIHLAGAVRAESSDNPVIENILDITFRDS